MEATQTPNPPAFETFLGDLQEIRQIMKEGAERHEREMKKLEEKTEKSRVEFNERLGKYINLFGEFTEYEMSPKMAEKFTEIGLDILKATGNVKVTDKINGIFLEIDSLLENDDIAVLVEIKTQLTVERINGHIERLEKMRKYADLHCDKRAFLGAVAGVVVADDARNYALDHGFYLIEPAGQDLNITPPNKKPKEW